MKRAKPMPRSPSISHQLLRRSRAAEISWTRSRSLARAGDGATIAASGMAWMGELLLKLDNLAREVQRDGRVYAKRSLRQPRPRWAAVVDVQINAPRACCQSVGAATPNPATKPQAQSRQGSDWLFLDASYAPICREGVRRSPVGR